MSDVLEDRPRWRMRSQSSVRESGGEANPSAQGRPPPAPGSRPHPRWALGDQWLLEDITRRRPPPFDSAMAESVADRAVWSADLSWASDMGLKSWRAAAQGLEALPDDGAVPGSTR